MTSRPRAAAAWLRTAGLAACWSFALCLITPSARASKPAFVEIDREAADDIDAELWPTLSELLARMGLSLVEDASEEAVAARVDLDESASGVTIEIENPRRPDETITRRVTHTESRAVFRETLAHVIASAVEPMAELPAKPPPEPPPAVPTPPSEHGVDEASVTEADLDTRFVLGARAGSSWITSDVARPAFGLSIGARFARRAEPSLVFEAQTVFPHAVERPGVDASLRATQLRLVGTLGALRWKRSVLDVGIAAGLDVLYFDASVVPPLMEAESSRRLQPVLGPRLAARVDVAHSLALLVSGGVDFDLAPRRWVVEQGERRPPVVETGRVHPQVFAALEWTFARRAREAGSSR